MCFKGNGDIFGDYALLNNINNDSSAITIIPSTMILITDFDLKNIIPEELLNLYNKTLKKYPNNTGNITLFKIMNYKNINK